MQIYDVHITARHTKQQAQDGVRNDCLLVLFKLEKYVFSGIFIPQQNSGLGM